MLLIEAKVIFQFYDAVTDNTLKPPTLPVIALVLLKRVIKDFSWLSNLGKQVQQNKQTVSKTNAMFDEE